MSRSAAPVDVKAAEEHLMRFLAVEGVTGEEACIAAVVSEELVKVGVPASAIRFDTANKRIPLPTQTGNLIVDLPGTRSGSRLLFATHLDTVPLCAGAKPRREGVRIAMLAVPAAAAQRVADLVVASGVKAILNFSPGTLQVPDDVKVKSVDLTVSLESLSFYLARGERDED